MQINETAAQASKWPKRLPRHEAVKYLVEEHGIKFSEKTLRNRHTLGTGPRCEYFGSRCYTTPPWLDEWVKEGVSAEPAKARRDALTEDRPTAAERAA
jgi:hypothetical protein